MKITLKLPASTNFITAAFLLVGGYVLLKVILYLLRSMSKPKSKKVRREEEEVDESKPKLRIYFGTQGGTAQRFAEQLEKEGKKNGFSTRAIDLAEFEPELITGEKTAVFVMASYGEGEPTDNARDFYEWIMQQSDEKLFSSLEFSVFGLGDTTYKHYQQVGRFIDKRLEELGGQRMFKKGEGDAYTTLEEDFVEWKEEFWPAMREKFNTTLIESDEDYKPNYSVEFLSEKIKDPKVFLHDDIVVDAKHPFYATVVEKRELLNDAERSTLHVVVDITGTSIHYESGDHLGIYPKNDPKLVEKVAERLNVLDKLDEHVRVMPATSEMKKNLFPLKRFVLRDIFSWHLDLTSVPRKDVLKVLALYAEDENEKDKLNLLGSHTPEGKLQYQKYIKEDQVDFLELLQRFPSVKPDLAHLFEYMPQLIPRYYSIASDPSVYKNSIHATVAVVDWKTPTGRHAHGVCSTFLKHINVGDRCPVYVRKSNFHLPSDPSIPLIMVGPGTGLAPFVGFLQKRHTEKRNHPDKTGEAYLYFGCRRRNEDFIYEKEMKEVESEGAITKVYTAFSREQERKVYVQDLMKQNAKEVWNVVSNGGYFYVCGDARRMAKDVDRMLAKIIQIEGKMTETEAEDFLENLTHAGKYLRDVWSP